MHLARLTFVCALSAQHTSEVYSGEKKLLQFNHVLRIIVKHVHDRLVIPLHVEGRSLSSSDSASTGMQ